MAERKNERYIYDDQGVRWENPFYEGEIPEVEIVAKYENATEEERRDIVRELLEKCSFAPNSVFVDGFKGGAEDEAIKQIMIKKLYEPISKRIEVMCPLCKRNVDPSHFKIHTYIFSRGCVFCDYPLKDTFPEYYHHIAIYHADEMNKYN